MKLQLMIVSLTTTFLWGAQPTFAQDLNQNRSSFDQRLESFLEKYSGSVVYEENAKYWFQGRYIKRPMLFVALKGEESSTHSVTLSDEFRRDYYRMLGRTTISLPMEEKIDFFRMRYKEDEVKVYGSMDRFQHDLDEKHLDIALYLTREEHKNLGTYLDNIEMDPYSTIGDAVYEGLASMKANGRLDDNRPERGGEGHNCTSWATLAPIGPVKRNGKRVTLYDLVGMESAYDEVDYPEVMRSPGWLGYYLIGSQQAKRVRLVTAFLDTTPEGLQDYRRGRRQKGIHWKWKYEVYSGEE